MKVLGVALILSVPFLLTGCPCDPIPLTEKALLGNWEEVASADGGATDASVGESRITIDFGPTEYVYVLRRPGLPDETGAFQVCESTKTLLRYPGNGDQTYCNGLSSNCDSVTLIPFDDAPAACGAEAVAACNEDRSFASDGLGGDFKKR
jgi:hypothetical protein